jgi:hypothetical protein
MERSRSLAGCTEKETEFEAQTSKTIMEGSHLLDLTKGPHFGIVIRGGSRVSPAFYAIDTGSHFLGVKRSVLEANR